MAYAKKVLFALLVMGILLFAVSGCSKKQSVVTDTTPAVDSGANTNPAPEPKAKTYYVDIKDFSFKPADVNIKVGDTVIWANKDSMKHIVISENGVELQSDLIPYGAQYSHTFNQAGTYSYYCSIHPSMKGEIVVS